MATDETTFVTQVHLVNLTGVRDEGVQALILLATSLGWNVMMKRGQPAVLTSRDGTPKRLPTDGSIRMSVFQTALSTIMVHSGDQEPTLELIDAIIKTTKPSKDHQRRLRLAVGETPQEHRERVANAESRARHEYVDEEHLTQRIEVPVDEDTSALREGLMVPPAGPWDGEDHGNLVSREPYVAHYSGSTSTHGYVSKTSLERVFEDGYRDYECVVCGKAFGTPRSVGGHRQFHIKAGHAEPAGTYRDHRQVVALPKAQPTAQFVDELPSTEVHLEEQEQQLAEVAEALAAQREYVGKVITAGDGEAAIHIEEQPSDSDIVAMIVDLVLPQVMRQYDAVIEALTEERDAALKMAKDIENEFDALVDLLSTRKKK